VHRRDQEPRGQIQGFLIGEGSPSFPDDDTATRAFFFGDFSTTSLHRGIPGELARLQFVEQRAWIDKVRVAPLHLDVRVGGAHRVGTRVEINGSTLQRSKVTGVSGRVRLPLRDGLPDDAWLYLSRGQEWLDYRVLGRRLRDPGVLAASGVDVVVPDDPESQLLALVASGEGPDLEFKQGLPGSTDVAKRNVLKTVAAFANANGGTIVFGIDANEVTLVDLSLSADGGARDRLGDLVRRIVIPTPDFEVRLRDVNGKRLMVLTVRPGSEKPYGLRFGEDKQLEFFVRRGANTYPATQAEIRASVLSTVEAGNRRSPNPYGF
jgi:hypothetical protein